MDKLREKSFKSLLNYSSHILNYALQKDLTGDKESFLKDAKALNKFKALYDKGLTSEEIDDIVLPVFENYKELLYSDVNRTTWLKDSSMRFKLTDKHYIAIDRIYEIALDIREKLKEELKGLPESNWTSCQELIFPNILRLHLYRLFYFSVKEEADKIKIGTNTSTIERILGIDAEKTVVFSEHIKKKSSMPFDLGNGENPMDNIMKIASGFLENPQIKNALNKGDNSELSSEAVGDILGGAFKGEEMQGTLNNILQGIKGGGSPEDIFKDMGKLFANKDAREQMDKVAKTAFSTSSKNVLESLESTEGKTQEEIKDMSLKLNEVSKEEAVKNEINNSNIVSKIASRPEQEKQEEQPKKGLNLSENIVLE